VGNPKTVLKGGTWAGFASSLKTLVLALARAVFKCACKCKAL